MTSSNDREGRRLPVKLDATSNGEFAPIPLEPVHREANHVAMQAATANAKRLGVRPREFLVSACGAATALLGMNAASVRAGRTGGWYDVPDLAALEAEVARAAVDGDEFIFDVQGHFVNPTGAWLERLPAGARLLRGFTNDPRCEPHAGPGDLDYLRCVGQANGTCWCSGTEWHGRAAMRISVSSWVTDAEDVERSLSTILGIAASTPQSG